MRVNHSQVRGEGLHPQALTLMTALLGQKASAAAEWHCPTGVWWVERRIGAGLGPTGTLTTDFTDAASLAL